MDPRIGERRADVARRRVRRRRLVLVGGGSVVGLLVVGWFVLHSSLMAARVLTVAGAPQGEQAAVLAAAGLSQHPPLIDVNPGAAAARVEALPWVLQATVSRLWPDGAHVRVTRRIPVGVVPAGPGKWAEVDRTGRVLADLAAPPVGLPRLTVPGAPREPGSWLAPASGPGVTVAATLPAAFVAQVVTVEAPAGAPIRLQLTTPISVLLGDTTQLTSKYRDVASILVHAYLHPGDVIDVTVPGSPVISGP